jgi:hypothetical protein
VRHPRRARMSDYRATASKIILALVFVVGAAAIVWSWSQPFQGCAVQPLTEAIKLGLSQYSQTVQQVLTLSTALAALGAAVLLGFREAPRLTKSRRILIFASTCCFVFSAYFGLLWQTRIAALLLLECSTSITAPMTQIPFKADTYFFVGGLVLIGVVIMSAAFDRSLQKVDNDGEPTH